MTDPYIDRIPGKMDYWGTSVLLYINVLSMLILFVFLFLSFIIVEHIAFFIHVI